MPKQVVEALVEAGKASAGPPLGPALGPLGVPIPKVIAEINEKTKDMKGMQVPIKVIVDTETKEFVVEVGTPPTSALIKKEAGVELGSHSPGKEFVGNLTLDQVIKIANIKKEDLMGKTLKEMVKEVIGTAVSLGITIEGKNPKEFLRDVEEGKVEIK